MMVSIGYEVGTKGYRLYDPMAKKLHISQDIIFEENQTKRFNEEISNELAAPMFEVELYTIVGQGTITNSGNLGVVSEDLAKSFAPNLGSPSPGQWSFGTDLGVTLAQSTSLGSPV
jgi:hypothetical protein